MNCRGIILFLTSVLCFLCSSASSLCFCLRIILGNHLLQFVRAYKHFISACLYKIQCCNYAYSVMQKHGSTLKSGTFGGGYMKNNDFFLSCWELIFARGCGNAMAKQDFVFNIIMIKSMLKMLIWMNRHLKLGKTLM